MKYSLNFENDIIFCSKTKPVLHSTNHVLLACCFGRGNVKAVTMARDEVVL